MSDVLSQDYRDYIDAKGLAALESMSATMSRERFPERYRYVQQRIEEKRRQAADAGFHDCPGDQQHKTDRASRTKRLLGSIAVLILFIAFGQTAIALTFRDRSPLLRYLIGGATGTAAALFYAKHRLKYTLSSLGIKRTGFIPNAAIGMLGGLISGVGMVSVLTATHAGGAASDLYFGGITILAFPLRLILTGTGLLALFIAVTEEVLFRGVLFRMINEWCENKLASVLIVSLLFVFAFHSGRTIEVLLVMLISDVCLTAAFAKTQNLILPIVWHATYDLFLFSLWGLAPSQIAEKVLS